MRKKKGIPKNDLKKIDFTRLILFILFMAILTNIVMYVLGKITGYTNIPTTGAFSGVLAYYIVFHPELVYGKKFAKK